MTSNVFLSFLVLCCCYTALRGQMLSSCCLSASSQQLGRKAPLIDYRHQVAGHGCQIDAMIFVCRGGAKLCLATETPGAQRAMELVDRLRKFCEKNKHKAKRCLGVRPE